MKKRTALSAWWWLLWLWLAAVIVGAFEYAPLAAKFIGQSSRILFFHVPMAWAAFTAFITAGVYSVRYLFGGRSRDALRQPRHDRAARAAIELGLLFGVLATVTGAVWSRIMWGAYWNWDPRQIWIVAALIFNGAYLALRDAVEDLEKRARLAAAYAALGLVVTPFCFFVLPRIAGFTLHPEPVINARGKIEMEPRMLQVLLASGLGFMALFFWLHDLRTRMLAIADRAVEAAALGARPVVAASAVASGATWSMPHPGEPTTAADPATASQRTGN